MTPKIIDLVIFYYKLFFGVKFVLDSQRVTHSLIQIDTVVCHESMPRYLVFGKTLIL